MKISGDQILTPRLLLRQKAKDDIFSFFNQSGVKNYLLYGYGRVALLDGLKILGCKRGENVLLPSYICDVAVEPFYELGIQVRFYKILMNLQPDLTDVENKIDEKTRAILVVNYFGFPQERMDEIQKMCVRYGIYLIEDNAHGFLSRKDSRLLGTFGDIGFSSLWKILPVPNGAVLFINNDSLTGSIKNPHPPSISQNKFQLSDYKYCLHSLLNYLEIQYNFPSQVIRDIYGRVFKKVGRDSSREYQDSKVPISKITLQVINNIAPNEVVRMRRENYKFWLEKMSKREEIKIVFEDLPEGVCPQIFPVIVKKADSFMKEMLDKGIYVFPWPYLPHEIEDNSEFPTANFLSKHLVALPVHQNVGRNNLKKVV